MTDKKPPTQVAGVQGFVAFEAKPDPVVPEIDLSGLVQLPPFQMFMVEVKCVSTDFAEAPGHYLRLICDTPQKMQELYDQYVTWHKDKGYWPNETPHGELIGGE